MWFWELGKRNLKEIYREPVAVGFLLGMPIAFMVIFCFAFGGEHATPISTHIVDEDQSRTSAAFIHCLENIPALELSEPIYTDESKAEEDLRNGKIPFYLVIPSGFEEVKQAQTPVNLKLAYKGADPMIAQRVVPIMTAAASEFLGIPPPLNIELKGTEVKIKDEMVNFFVPGVIVFGLMILIPTGARIIVADKETRFLARMLTTPARPWNFILGYSLPLVLVLLVSAAIYLGVGMLMGLSIIGNLGLAFLIFFIVGLCSIGVAMIIGTFIKSGPQVEGACWIIIVPLAMISGAWWPVEQMPWVLKGIAGALPFIHAIDASRDVVTGGASFSVILPDFYWLIGWTVVLFAAGVTLFRTRMIS